jgi:hypothetical protein
MIDAALGLRVHTGWAAAVVLVGSASAPQVVDRRRLTLVENTEHDAVFVYHAAADLDGAAAGRHVAAARDIAQTRALREIAQLLSELAAAGYSVRAVGLQPSEGRPLPALTDILRSHPLIHAAEGELFRRALTDACARHGLRVVGVPSKKLHQRAARASGLGADSVKRRIAELGRSLGPPWALDQKEAALAALIAGAEGTPS